MALNTEINGTKTGRIHDVDRSIWVREKFCKTSCKLGMLFDNRPKGRNTEKLPQIDTETWLANVLLSLSQHLSDYRDHVEHISP